MDDAFLIKWAEQNLRRHLTGVAAHLPDMTVIERAGSTLVDTGLPSDTLNTVCDARRHLLTSDDVRWVLEYYRERQLPFTWWVGPSGLWAGDVLCEHGLALTAIDMGMAADLRHLDLRDPLQRADVRRALRHKDVLDHLLVVESILATPDDSLRRFYQHAAAIILRPTTDRYLFTLYDDNAPQSTVEVCVSDAIVGLYAVVTRPAARGRGDATAVVGAALRFARDELQAEAVVLQSGPRARPLFERLGLRAIGEFHEFVPEVNEAEWAG